MESNQKNLLKHVHVDVRPIAASRAFPVEIGTFRASPGRPENLPSVEKSYKLGT